MDNQIKDTPKENITGKRGLAMPIIAILTEIFPFIFMLIGYFTGLNLLMLLILPIVGLVLGVVALCKGKGKPDIGGRIIAVIAVALPVLWVSAIIVFFIGISTNLISLM